MKVSDVKQPRPDLRPLLHLTDKPLRRKNTISLLAIRTEQYGYVQLLHIHLKD
jgi:hypothetical protein